MQLILRQSSESVQSVQDTVGMGQTESQAGRSKLILKTAKQNKPEKNAHKEFDVGLLEYSTNVLVNMNNHSCRLKCNCN